MTTVLTVLIVIHAHKVRRPVQLSVVGHRTAPHGSHPFLKCASTATTEVPMSNAHADAFNYGKSLLKL